jgi:hypothetical protein
MTLREHITMKVKDGSIDITNTIVETILNHELEVDMINVRTSYMSSMSKLFSGMLRTIIQSISTTYIKFIANRDMHAIESV